MVLAAVPRKVEHAHIILPKQVQILFDFGFELGYGAVQSVNNDRSLCLQFGPKCFSIFDTVPQTRIVAVVVISAHERYYSLSVNE